MQFSPTPANNLALSFIFHQVAACYRYLGNEERFRAIAYEKVSRVLQNMKEDIASYATDVKTLDDIGGIGESIAEKIMEYLQTGKVKVFEKLKMQVPFELLELIDVNGLGPATLRQLHDELNISTKEELLHAINTNRLSALKNFGEKKIEIIKQAFKETKTASRIPLAAALAIGNEMLAEIKKLPGVKKAALAGSLRRKKETIGDIDIVIAAETKFRKRIADRFVKLPQVEKIIAKGTTKASVLLKNKVQVDIRIVHDYEYGAALLYFTGSKEHNIKLRIMARNRGYKINEYGIFEINSGKRVAGETEEEMYAFLDLKYIEPEQRLDTGEIEASAKKVKNN